MFDSVDILMIGIGVFLILLILLIFRIIKIAKEKNEIETPKAEKLVKKKIIKKEKEYSPMKKYILIAILISVTIIASVIVIMYFNYQKELLAQNTKKELLEIQQREAETKEQNRQMNLTSCINTADANYRELWKINSDKNGLIKSASVGEWVEGKYNQDLKLCTDRYK